MKIEQIVLDNFGIYSRKSFDFGGAPLVLIYGPNESGKTTALNGIRQALCGFRPRTPYLLPNRTMSAELRAQMLDGSILQFHRRKSRQDEVSGSLGSKRLQAEDVRRLLCDLDLDSYEQLFGFSLDELRKGEAALKSARLVDALAGGGLGGMTALQDLRIELENSLAELYKARGSTSRINLKLAEIEQSREQLRQVQVLPSAVDELRNQLSAAQLESEDLKREYARVFGARSVAQRILDALPKFRERQQIQRQLEEIDIPEGIDATFVAGWTDFVERRKQTIAKLEQESRSLDQERQQMAALGVCETLFPMESEIEQLGHQADAMGSARVRLAELKEQADDALAMCARLLENLELPKVSDRLRDFAISAPARKELESLSSRFVELGRQREQLVAKLEAAQEALLAIQNATESEPLPDNLSHLKNLVSQLVESERDFEMKTGELKTLTEDADFNTLADRLPQSVQGITSLQADWRVPTSSVISQYSQTSQQLTQDFAGFQTRIEELKQRIQKEQSELRRLQKDSASARNMQHAEELRRKRIDLIERWLDELTEPLIAASLGPQVQAERLQELQLLLAEGDELQMQMLSAADALALTNQKSTHLQELSSQLKTLQEHQQATLESQKELGEKWLLEWRDCPFRPDTSPSRMQSWVQDYERWRTIARRSAEIRRQAHIARSILRQQRLELQDVWPANLPEDVATESLQDCLRQWDEASRNAHREKQRHSAAVANVESLQLRIESLRAQQQQVADKYAEWLTQSPIANWPLEQLGTLLDSIEHLRREDATARRALQQIDQLESQLKSYHKAIAELARKMGEPLGEGLPEVIARRWLQQSQENRQHHSERVRLTASIEHRARAVQELTTRQREIDSRLASLCSAAGRGDALGMGALIDIVQRAEQLKSRQAEMSAALEAHRGSESPEEFNARLDGADDAALTLEVQELQRQLLALDEARKQADENVGSLSQRIEHLANNQAAARNLQQLHSQRGELAELAEQWCVERIAQELLSRSIERFAADNEPALLQLSRHFLAKLTGGKYTSIDHDSTNPGNFLVRNVADEGFEPGLLSTGTREQLYLALRLAFITYHSEHHEPMPVVMDDCFVNFDDQRTRFALETIAHWDDSIQTILLSCHWRVVELLATVLPDTLVMELEQNRTTTAAELASQRAVV